MRKDRGSYDLPSFRTPVQAKTSVLEEHSIVTMLVSEYFTVPVVHAVDGCKEHPTTSQNTNAPCALSQLLARVGTLRKPYLIGNSFAKLWIDAGLDNILYAMH